MTPPQLGAAERLWLYATVERELLAAAMGRGVHGGSVAVLNGGCDHTLAATTAWALARGVDPGPVVEALAARGGVCDCQVLLTAARADDPQLAKVIVEGEVVGLSALFDVALATEGEPEPVAAGRPSQVLWIERAGDRAAILAQVIDSGVVPRLLDVLTTGGSEGTFSLRYPDAGEPGDRVVGRGGAVTIQPLGAPHDPGR